MVINKDVLDSVGPEHDVNGMKRTVVVQPGRVLNTTQLLAHSPTNRMGKRIGKVKVGELTD